MVSWLNGFGGEEQFLFQHQQNFRVDAGRGTIFDTVVSWDLSNENRRTKGRIDVNPVQQILLRAEQLTIDQLTALTEIKLSDFVFIYLTKDGTEQMPVVVAVDFVTEHLTDGGFFDFTVLLELPDGVNFNQVKKY